MLPVRGTSWHSVVPMPTIGHIAACSPIASQTKEIFSPKVSVVVGVTVNEMIWGLVMLVGMGEGDGVVSLGGVAVTT